MSGGARSPARSLADAFSDAASPPMPQAPLPQLAAVASELASASQPTRFPSSPSKRRKGLHQRSNSMCNADLLGDSLSSLQPFGGGGGGGDGRAVSPVAAERGFARVSQLPLSQEQLAGANMSPLQTLLSMPSIRTMLATPPASLGRLPLLDPLKDGFSFAHDDFRSPPASQDASAGSGALSPRRDVCPATPMKSPRPSLFRSFGTHDTCEMPSLETPGCLRAAPSPGGGDDADSPPSNDFSMNIAGPVIYRRPSLAHWPESNALSAPTSPSRRHSRKPMYGGAQLPSQLVSLVSPSRGHAVPNPYTPSVANDSLGSSGVRASASPPDEESPYGLGLEFAWPEYNGRFETDFEVKKELGSGSYGRVVLALKRVDGWMYAIKQTNRAPRSAGDRRDRHNEVYALAAAESCPYLVRYYDAWIESDNLFIQTEFCENGSLERALKGQMTLGEPELLSIMFQIATGLQHLHGHNLVHMDVKPANIFISKNNIYKLGDFGLVQRADTDDPREGTGRYLDQAVLSGNARFLTKADVFSLGASIYELSLGRELSSTGDEYTDIRNGRLTFGSQYSAAFRELIGWMMHREPARRPDTSELLKHALLQPFGGAGADVAQLRAQVQESARTMDALRGEMLALRAHLDTESRLRRAAEEELDAVKRWLHMHSGALQHLPPPMIGTSLF